MAQVLTTLHIQWGRKAPPLRVASTIMYDLIYSIFFFACALMALCAAAVTLCATFAEGQMAFNDLFGGRILKGVKEFALTMFYFAATLVVAFVAASTIWSVVITL